MLNETCECGHSKEYHNLGNKKLESGCNFVVDDDGASYGLCDCQKFKPIQSQEVSAEIKDKFLPDTQTPKTKLIFKWTEWNCEGCNLYKMLAKRETDGKLLCKKCSKNRSLAMEIKDKTADTQTPLSEMIDLCDNKRDIKKYIKQTLSKVMNEIDNEILKIKAEPLTYHLISKPARIKHLEKAKEIIKANFGKDFFDENQAVRKK